MNKKTLGIVIPYYKNSEICEIAFKGLMEQMNEQITDDMILFVWEDGQLSEWLQKYNKENIIIAGSTTNHGVSFARNQGIDYLIKKVKYILFLDSDDMVDDNYLSVIRDNCLDETHEIIETNFVLNLIKTGKTQYSSFDYNLVRSSACGSAIKCEVIGDNRFKENTQISEDVDFMNTIIDLKKYRKKHAITNYYYQYGKNDNSLSMRYQRKEIDKERGNENE